MPYRRLTDGKHGTTHTPQVGQQKALEPSLRNEHIITGSASGRADSKDSCLPSGAKRVLQKKIRTRASGTRLMKRYLLVFPLRVSQARESCIALVSAWCAIVSLIRFKVDGRIFSLWQGQQLDNRVCLFVNLASWKEFPVQEVLHCTTQAHIVYKWQAQVDITLRVDNPRHLVHHGSTTSKLDCSKRVPDFVCLWYGKGRGRPKTRQDIQRIVS